MNRKRILVVDDDAVVVTALSMKLQSSGYDVLRAFDGSEAVNVARTENPDVILLDISFPPDVAHGGIVAWDGFRTIEWLRRIDEKSRHIPIIVITESEAAEYKERALDAGAMAFFHKPFKNEELLATIEKALSNPS